MNENKNEGFSVNKNSDSFVIGEGFTVDEIEEYIYCMNGEL